ncbi:hypothetical protein LCGC14_2679880, partial [marine sediment metagenome]
FIKSFNGYWDYCSITQVLDLNLQNSSLFFKDFYPSIEIKVFFVNTPKKAYCW